MKTIAWMSRGCHWTAACLKVACTAGMMLTVGTATAGNQISCAGRVDMSFHPPSAPELAVPLYIGKSAFTVPQADGKILFGGQIHSGEEGNDLVRLTSNGAIDSSFDGTAIHQMSLVTALALQSDGKILVAGSALVRLLANGTPDPDFNVQLNGDGNWWERTPTQIALQSDGKIIVAGAFTQANGSPVQHLIRLRTDGSIDPQFTVPGDDLPENLDAVLVQPDGRILLAGYSINETELHGYFLRLLSTGVRDTSFNFASTSDRGIAALAWQPDGKILASGYYWHGYYRSHGFVIRLDVNGSVDSTFGGGPGQVEIIGYDGEGVSAMVVQPDGKILLGGSFFDSEDWENRTGSFARLNADGSRDAGFRPGFVVSGGDDDIESVTSIALQTDGRILIAGDFSSVGGVTRPGLARLFSGSDDCPAVIEFSADHYTAQEGFAVPAVTIQRAGSTLPPLTVRYTVQNLHDDSGGLLLSGIIGGIAADDFTQTSGEVSFAAGESLKSFVVPVRSDGLVESTESFQLVLTEASDVVAFGDRTTALLHVFDAESVGLPGAVDADFFGQISGTVKALVTQPDGKLLVGGAFSSLDGFTRNNLLRLNSDGTLDLSFNPDPMLPEVTAIGLYTDGRMAIGGSNEVTRLKADGSIDQGFQPFTATSVIAALAVQSDGRILVGGDDGLWRLNTDGSRDDRFVAFSGMPETNHVSIVRALVLQPDGKIFAGGQNSLTHWPALVRLNSDGTGDPTFQAGGFREGYHGGFDLGILSLLQQPDGKIVVGGGFSYVRGNDSRWNLLRLNADGTVDESFEANRTVNTYIKAMARQSDGKLLIAGYFWSWDYGRNIGLDRLFEDGRSDHAFIVGTGALAAIDAIALQPSGAIWIGGTFEKYNGFPQAGLARLYGDDQSGPGRVEFVRSYGSIKENAGQILLQLRRYWGADGVVSVHYATTNGTALAGQHYVGQSGTIVFGDGEIEKTLAVGLLDDSTPEMDRYFFVSLTDPDGGATLGQFSNTWVNIIENDRGILARRSELIGNNLYVRDDFAVRENAGSIRIELFYVGDPTDDAIRLDYETSDGSAHAGFDYTARSGWTAFNGPYSRQQDFSVAILNDSTIEGPESFTIHLHTAPGVTGVTVMPTNIVVTILEGDPMLRLETDPAGPSADGHFRMLLSAPASVAFSLEASADLVSWNVLKTFAPRASDDLIPFEDATATKSRQRFYRLTRP